jgi:hypothetical protein
MTVSDVIDLAKYGELKTLSVKDNHKAVIGYMNLGLIELYKRFSLSLKEWVIEMVENQTIYGEEDPEHPENTFPTDLLHIIAAYDEKIPGEMSDATLPVNDEFCVLAVNHVQWNRIQIPYPVDGVHVSIIYRSAPDLLKFYPLDPNNPDEEQADPATMKQVVPIPYTMLEPLLYYIGYRGHTSMEANVQGESATHYTRFEQSCARIENMGLVTADSLDMSYKFFKRGFA